MTLPPPVPVSPALAGVLAAGGPRLGLKLLASYHRTAPQRLAAVRAAVDSRNMHGARATFHQLKGSSAQLGFTAVAAACLVGEHAATSGDGVATAAACAAVAEALTHVARETAALEAWLHAQE
jgi:HPt (histidine-containing phosphotransfer) domain-containing protein